MGKIPAAAGDATILVDLPGGALKPDRIADLALGVQLRAYAFDRYKTKRKEAEGGRHRSRLRSRLQASRRSRRRSRRAAAVADGVVIARDLVNEPANVLYPEEFARRTGNLKGWACSLSVLDVKEMKKLGMNALLGVGLGSQHESRTVIMRWNGGKRGVAPLAFIGKGVCFDTGGISIKPAAGMEDMKGDMAGAACVVGLMHALAARKAKVNAVGAIRNRGEHARRQSAAPGRYRQPRCRGKRSRSSIPTPRAASCSRMCSTTSTSISSRSS